MTPHVLLISGSLYEALPLADVLRRRGCEVHAVTSFAEARILLEQRACKLVLSKMRLQDQSAYPLMALLAASQATLFFFVPVEGGCWWLPALRHGHNCLGEPALRPAEFRALLDELLGEPSPLPAPSVALVPAPFSES